MTSCTENWFARGSSTVVLFCRVGKWNCNMCGIVQILHSIPSKSLFEESSLKFYGLLKKTVSGGYRRIKHCSRIDFVPPCMKFGKIRS